MTITPPCEGPSAMMISARTLRRYRDVVQAFRDPRLCPPAHAGPEPGRLRKLAERGFTPALLLRARGVITRTAEALLDRVEVGSGQHRVETVADPLPATVLVELFDLPAEKRALFRLWSSQGSAELKGLFLELIEERRRRPGHDLMSLLVQFRPEETFDPEEVCSLCVRLATEDCRTAEEQLCNLFQACRRYPDQFALLLRNPALVPSGVEEVLRHEGAIPVVLRVAREDLEIHGQLISKGQLVYLSVAEANRDPEVFRHPDQFDVTRRDNHHIAFGLDHGFEQ
jgi:pimeloyl-[acyl-carrier protein] synthase